MFRKLPGPVPSRNKFYFSTLFKIESSSKPFIHSAKVPKKIIKENEVNISHRASTRVKRNKK